MNNLRVALDIGHSSIGWAVLESKRVAGAKLDSAPPVDLLGCGAVIFRADDCLASKRRDYRRQRRHIRSTRQRIARLKLLLRHLGVLSSEELDRPGCAWPWQLAAQVLASKSGQNPAVLLTWPQLWDVLRWYAHNRGYDGNRRWSGGGPDAQDEDTEKEENARGLMKSHGTASMAETFCAVCGIDPLGTRRSCNIAPSERFKAKNAAFPRAIVEGEMRRILQAHVGKLPGLDLLFEKALCDDWKAITCPAVKLPKRYQGGYLFGQLVPRFDNRIIATCPFTYQQVFQAALKSGSDPEVARQTAEKQAKVPSRNCREFLNYRWGMQLANIQVKRFGESVFSDLKAEERQKLDGLMRQTGSMGVEEFKKAVRETSGAIEDNLESMFMHPDAKEALLLDPVQKLVNSAELGPFWKLLSNRVQKRLRGKWRLGKVVSLGEIREASISVGGDIAAFDAEIQRQIDASNTRSRKKQANVTRDELLVRLFPSRPIRLDGRAPYGRKMMEKAFEEALSGLHPKGKGNCLEMTEQIRQAQLERALDEQTNNHLVRHRLRLVGRLLDDITKSYADGEASRISKVTLEVNRDLREMSGKTAKEKAQDLGLRIANHHHVVEKLERDLPGERITAGLIRKARVAEDLGWRCPYTGMEYQAKQLATGVIDRDHIIPRSERASDSLDSLVITFAAINKWKGKRTAYQFVKEEEGKPVPGIPNLSILSLRRYEDLVDALDTFKGHDDDKRRKERRKRLLRLGHFTDKEFTPRDLTQTSQLARMAQQLVLKQLRHLQPHDVTSLPGSVTGVARKSWKLLACLGLAAPAVIDQNNEVKKKDDIRDITHLHHGLDACVLGLIAHFIPSNGRIWELMVKRNPNDQECRQLSALGIFEFDSEGRFHITDLPANLKESIRLRLAEKRVVQHIPARMTGLRVEQNMWRVIAVKDGIAEIEQRVRQPDASRPPKSAKERVTKLLGLQSGKLQKNKGVLVIPDNFGVALDPVSSIIPFHKVWVRLIKLKEANGGKAPRIIRNGQLIRVHAGRFKGVWKVFSAKNNSTGIALDIGFPDVVRLKNKTEGHKINVRLESLLSSGLEILKTPLTGVACPTTSSA